MEVATNKYYFILSPTPSQNTL
uniref:Uncharacterized protein n=1 Tax=Moniliophthora roreri TaxID=221103 RepID=A0A0W0FZF2_MONRR